MRLRPSPVNGYPDLRPRGKSKSVDLFNRTFVLFQPRMFPQRRLREWEPGGPAILRATVGQVYERPFD